MGHLHIHLMGTERQWNIANNNIYIDSINKGIIPFEKEELTTVQKLNEYIMISLRTMEGISFEVLNSKFGVEQAEFLNKSKKFIENRLDEIEKQFTYSYKRRKVASRWNCC